MGEISDVPWFIDFLSLLFEKHILYDLSIYQGTPRNAELRHRRNTRYGRVANPYPTGIYTLQNAPSFAWRSNILFSGRGFFRFAEIN